MTNVIKKLIPDSLREYKRGYQTIVHKNKGASLFDSVIKGKVVIHKSNNNEEEEFVKQLRKIAVTQKYNLDYYIYPFDTWCIRNRSMLNKCIVSVTVDYSKVLNSNLLEIKNNSMALSDTIYSLYQKEIESIEIISNRIKKLLQNQVDKRSTELLTFFPSMLYKRPSSFDEALQKVLFYNALFWQVGHMHVGLGRLDYCLYDYYKYDIERGILTRNGAKNKLIHFCRILHRDVYAKSGVLIGDTGQYIMLGGVDSEGNTIQNELTELFLEIISDLNIPDPKLILRVNRNTSNVIWKLSVESLKKGNGSPLIINEDYVMKGMEEFGYDKDDIWNFGTSACWEPLIIGKSFDQNNLLPNISIITCVNDLLFSGKDFESFNNFLDDLFPLIKRKIVDNVYDTKSDCSPLYSLFFDDCLKRGKDFARGGAKYSYHGIQIVGFPNTINALLNIKRYVFDEKLITMDDCKRALLANYLGYEDLQLLFLKNELAYGSNKSEIVNITNMLMDYISKITQELKINGNKIKVGYSSSEFIIQSKNTKATLDGRNDFAPFAVHISPVSQEIDIQEILDFAGSLDYSGNKMNGNVVDFIIPPSYMQHSEKLVNILKNAMTNGVYELQLNVLDKKTLVDAKINPNKYPNLIVRVWGFSAYFNDLPDDYKDNLIRRAEYYNPN